MEQNKNNQLEVLKSAKQNLEYMRRCAYTEQVPADSEDLIKLIRELEELIARPAEVERLINEPELRA